MTGPAPSSSARAKTERRHQVEGESFEPPGYEVQQAAELPVAVAAQDEQTVAVGTVTEPGQSHRETAFDLAVAEGSRALHGLGERLGRQVALADDLAGAAGTPHAVDGLADVTHGAALQGEGGDVEDCFAAEFDDHRPHGHARTHVPRQPSTSPRLPPHMA
jgi:hypothetical protein